MTERQQLEWYKSIAMRRLQEADMAEIKAAFPDETALEVAELGTNYLKLRACGVDNLEAYRAVRGAREDRKAASAAPDDIGPVSTDWEGGEKAFYTSREVDGLSAEQLAKPGVLKNVMASMTRWKR